MVMQPCSRPIGRCAEHWSSAAGALWHNAGSGRCFSRADRLSGGHGVGIGDWVAPCRDDLVPSVPLGGWGDAHLADLRSRADLDHVAVGTSFLLAGSAFLLLAIATPPDAWMLRMAAGLVVRVVFLLLSVAALLLGIAVLLDRWQRGGSHCCIRGRRPAGRCCDPPGRLDPGRNRAAGRSGHGPAARGRVPLGQMDTAWRPIPDVRGRGHARRYLRPCWPD